MGKTLFGGITNEGNAQLLTPEQQSFLSNILGGQQQAGQQAYSDFLQPYNPQQFQQFYQQSFIDPAQKALQQQIIPGLKEQFLGQSESGSSSLNRALAQSATDLSSQLGKGILGQYNQMQQQRMGALGGLQGLVGQRAFQPIFNQQQGSLGDLIQAGATLGGAAIMSSRDYKENIVPFNKGMDALSKMKAYAYDYKPEYGDLKDNIGLMVEDAPEEIIKLVNGKVGIDIYGLISLLVNSVNELSERVENLYKINR